MTRLADLPRRDTVAACLLWGNAISVPLNFGAFVAQGLGINLIAGLLAGMTVAWLLGVYDTTSPSAEDA